MTDVQKQPADAVGSSEGLGLGPERDALAEQLACVRQALPEEWRDSVPSVAVATLTEELISLRHSSATYFAERNSARDAWRARLNECEVLALKNQALRRELEKVNNEFGSQTADWPDAWRRVAEVKDRAGRYWNESETLRAALRELAARTDELVKHLQDTGRLRQCFNMPALDAAHAVLGPNV